MINAARISFCLAVPTMLLAPACGDDAQNTESSAATGTSSAGAGSGGSSASGSGGSAGGSPAIDYCSQCQAPMSAGTVSNGAINECSGIVASAIHPNTYYVHNDSGDSPRFFAIGSDASDKGTFNVMNATAIDWEDMARGPCPTGSCLYFADIGDNTETRNNYVVYRVPEPASVGSTGTVTAEALPFAYPDGSHNSETLLVDPMSGEIVIVTKVPGGGVVPAAIYEFPMPLTPGQSATLKKVSDLNLPKGETMTAGDAHPSGAGALLRTYNYMFFFPRTQGQTFSKALLNHGCQVPMQMEGQGEAVAWTIDGSGYVTLSEGLNQSLNEVRCN